MFPSDNENLGGKTCNISDMMNGISKRSRSILLLKLNILEGLKDMQWGANLCQNIVKYLNTGHHWLNLLNYLPSDLLQDQEKTKAETSKNEDAGGKKMKTGDISLLVYLEELGSADNVVDMASFH